MRQQLTHVAMCQLLRRATQEMWQAVTAVQQRVAAGQLAAADVSIDTIQQHLYTEVQLHCVSGQYYVSEAVFQQALHGASCPTWVRNCLDWCRRRAARRWT
jgi:hypothetical protein